MDGVGRVRRPTWHFDRLDWTDWTEGWTGGWAYYVSILAGYRDGWGY